MNYAIAGVTDVRIGISFGFFLASSCHGPLCTTQHTYYFHVQSARASTTLELSVLTIEQTSHPEWL